MLTFALLLKELLIKIDKMKKILIFAVVAMGSFSMFSCGAIGGAKMTTTEDSVAYALGVQFGTSAFQLDPDMNLKVLKTGIDNVFSKTEKMTSQEAAAYLQEYFTVTFPMKNLEKGKQFIEDAVKAGATKTESGLAYKFKKEGTGEKAALGDSVQVKYKLSLPNGSVLEENETTFLLQQGGLIEGWIEGLQLMNPGSDVTLYVPAELGYGIFGIQGSPIGPNQALKFDIELLKTVPGPKVEEPAEEGAEPVKE